MDQFKVGDKVWCLLLGEGTVTRIATDGRENCIIVHSDHGCHGYTPDGKMFVYGSRSLFFSKPEVSAREKRPFVSKLNGKFVVVTPYRFEDGYLVGEVHDEDEDCFFLDTGFKVMKNEVVRIQEISKENLLQ